MNKKIWKRILAIVILAALGLSLITIVPEVARAGFGDFDSGSDFGGSSRSSSSSDSDSFDLFEMIEFVNFIGRIFGIRSPVVSILIVVVILAVIKIGIPLLKGSLGSSSRNEGIQHRNEFRPDTLEQLRTEDPAYDPEVVIQRVQALYEKMQTCWEDGNIEPLRKDFMPDAWTRFDTQLQNKKLAGETSHVRDIVFNQVEIQNYAKDSEHQVLRVKLDVTHNVWTTDSKGKCIQGTEKTRKRFKYMWTMVRPLGARSDGSAVQDTTHCPNCGAEIDMEAFAECPFCHTPFMQVAPDWVISEIDALSQTTIHA